MILYYIDYIAGKCQINDNMNKSKLQGIITASIGAFVIYWAYSHSPKAGLGKIIGNELSGSYTMSETWYYASLALGIAIGVYGIYRFLTGK